MRLVTALAGAAALAVVNAYGWMGHEIIGTIAQLYLSPNATITVKSILVNSDGDLASVASWADRIKGRPEYRFSGHLHYINPVGDYPPSHCAFGWHEDEENVISAIHNYTSRLQTQNGWAQEEALRFLVHYVGDLHQPLHMTGRDRGGNSAPAIFEGHRTNLHRIWDSQILNKQLRELGAVSETQGKILAWSEHLELYAAAFSGQVGKVANSFFDLLSNGASRIATAANTRNPSELFHIQKRSSYGGNVYDPYVRYLLQHLAKTWKQEQTTWPECPEDASGNDTAPCPEYWAEQMTHLNCDVVWNGYDAHTELSDGEYYDRVKESLIVEKLLVMGGVRLAAILNTVFLDIKS